MGVNSLPKTANQQRRGCDLNPGPSAPESSTLTTRLPSHPEGRRRHEIEGTTPTFPLASAPGYSCSDMCERYGDTPGAR